VLQEVTEACNRKDANAPRFADWPAESLIAYIVGHHHAYVRRVLPAIVAHTRKVAEPHGARHPELNQIAEIFGEVADEMTSHIAKEEGILFPHIAKVVVAKRLGEPAPRAPFGPVEKPIAMMEHEHEFAGQAMARLRALSRAICERSARATRGNRLAVGLLARTMALRLSPGVLRRMVVAREPN
jgi:regulator of cell morphogenesis and NO signaling